MNLLRWQEQLENTGLAEGALRFKDRLAQAEAKGAGAVTGAARGLIREGLGQVEQRIREYCDEHKTASCVKWIQQLGPDVAAYMTLKVVLDATAGGTPGHFGPMALALADTILDELRYRSFRTKAPRLFKYRLEGFTTSNTRHKRRSLLASMRIAEIDTSDLNLSVTKRLHLGSPLVNLLVEATGWYECGTLSPESRKEHKKVVLVLKDETRKKLERENELLEALAPIVGPMVVAPLPWGPEGERGGYRFGLRTKFPLVRRVSESHLECILSKKMPSVYAALNAIQETPWRVNSRLLDLVAEIIECGGGIAGVPKAQDDPLPEQPEDIETNEEARKAWRTGAHEVRNQNHLRSMALGEVQRILAAATTVSQAPSIYFPHSLDFRGRIYPITSYLSPQGADLSRSLLLFANGRPVDAEGERWLAIAGANHFGVTHDGQRMSEWTFEERVQWVRDNQDAILEVASDPIASAWWAPAKEPLQFIAWCVEWAELVRAKERGEQFVSCYPVRMDGSCNGLQHYSALLRDERGGRAVNLLPAERPVDVYQDVANAVLRILMRERASEPLADQWLTLHDQTGIVNRSLTKRPVMTWPYGSKAYGFKQQLVEYLRGLPNIKQIEAVFEVEGKHRLGFACFYLAKIMSEAMREVSVSAYQGMRWLQECTKGITKENRFVRWTVPGTGFLVRQPYSDNTTRFIHTTLAGCIVNPSVKVETNKVDRRRQRNAIAPNAIHSFDAAVLMWTVEAATREGIESFSMIHDSYGTVAADAGKLARILREEFVRFYTEQDVVGKLHCQLSKQWSDPRDCPDPPAKGTLVLEDVELSTYFFS